jgi:argininosuccinate lyase
MAQSNDSLWGGRFASGPSHALAALSKSTHFDFRLASYDLKGTGAHIKALLAAGYLSKSEFDSLESAISELDSKIKGGDFVPKFEEEDVHAALERGLIEIAGADVAGKVRAGRSRNDQIATLIRSFLLDASEVIQEELEAYIKILMERATEHLGAPMPGRTHFQHAQPVLLSHHLLAHAWPMVRNIERLKDWRVRAGLSPYGAGALAGNTLGLDPELVASQLGFAGTTQNSMDATSARDVVAEFAFIAAMVSVDLSRFAEEIIAWSTYEFGYVKLHDSFSTGSSIMPQKKNPDIAELARGKSGRLIGNLSGLMATLKALPLSYNRDLQEDKEPVFDSVDSLLLVLPAFTGLVATLRFDLQRMASLAPAGFALATDVAEWLVKQGVVFRDAHEITGELVRFCEDRGLELDQPTDEQYQSISKHLKPALRAVLTVSGAIEGRNGAGGTASSQVLIQLEQLNNFLDQD